MEVSQSRHFGLIGKSLQHSFSATYFKDKFTKEAISNSQYDLYELADITEFEKLISERNFIGLNVTIPYKREIIPFLDDLDGIANSVQAVNTIKFTEGKLIGYNTDVIGFMNSMKSFIGRKKLSSALVLGTGGASLAVQFGLKKMGIEFKVVSRSSGDYHYDEVDKEILRAHRLIVNCTPLGTFPDVHLAPKIPYAYLTRKHLLFDLVYNPEKTLFLELGEQKGCSIMNGNHMLVGQAEAAWTIWNTD